MNHPIYLRQTALWLSTEKQMSYRQIAQALSIPHTTVARWVRAAGVSRAQGAAVETWHRHRNPAIDRRRAQAYALYYHEGLTYEAVAERLGVSTSTAYNDVCAVLNWPPIRRPNRHVRPTDIEPQSLPNHA